MRSTCVSWENAWTGWVCFCLQSGVDVDTRRMVETTLLVDWVGQCVKGIIGRRGAAQGVFHHLAQLKGQLLGHVLIQWSRPCTGRDARSTFGAALSIEHGMASQASADILACQNWSDPTRPLDSGSVHSLATRGLNPPTLWVTGQHIFVAEDQSTCGPASVQRPRWLLHNLDYCRQESRTLVQEITLAGDRPVRENYLAILSWSRRSLLLPWSYCQEKGSNRKSPWQRIDWSEKISRRLLRLLPAQDVHLVRARSRILPWSYWKD